MAFDPNTGVSWEINPFKETASDQSMALMGTCAQDALAGNSLEGTPFDFLSFPSQPNTLTRSERQAGSNAFVPWARNSVLGEETLSSGSENSPFQFSGNQFNLPEIDLDTFLDDPFPDIDLDQPVPDFSNTTPFIDPWRAVTPTAQLDCPYRLTGRNHINFSPKSSAEAPSRIEPDSLNHFPQNICSSVNPVCVSPTSLDAPYSTQIATPIQPNPLFHSPTNPSRLTPTPPSPQTPTKPQEPKLSKNSTNRSLRSKKTQKKLENAGKLYQSSLSTLGTQEKAKTTFNPSSTEPGSFPASFIDSSYKNGMSGNLWSAVTPNSVQPVAGSTPNISSFNNLHPAFRPELFPNPLELIGSTPFGTSNFSSIKKNSLSSTYAPFAAHFGSPQDGIPSPGCSQSFTSTALNPSLYSNPVFTNSSSMPGLSFLKSYDSSRNESPTILMAQSRSDPETYQHTDKSADTSNPVQGSVSLSNFSTPISVHDSPMHPSHRAARPLAGLSTATFESFSRTQPQPSGSAAAGLSTPVPSHRATYSHPSPSQSTQPGFPGEVDQADRSSSPSKTSNTPSTSPTRCKASFSVFVNFTPKDSKKLLSGVAPSGSSKRKRTSQQPPSSTSSKRHVVTT